MKKIAAEYVITNNYDNEWREHYSEYTGSAYPTYVYYINLNDMVLGHATVHWHKEIEIDYIREGSAIFNVCGQTQVVNEGESIVINEGRVHSIYNAEPAKPCVIISVLFDVSYIFESDDSFLSLKYKNSVTNNPSAGSFIFSRKNTNDRDCLRLIEALMKTNLDKKYGYELQTKSLLCNFWTTLLERSDELIPSRESELMSVNESRVKCAVAYIHSNYMNEITLDDIAQSIHVSKSECCRCFKKTTNLSPFEYLMRERIIESARKMQRNDAESNSINELAISVGFNNSSYYNKIFKKYMLTTPTHYRDAIKKSHRDSLSPFGISLSRI